MARPSHPRGGGSARPESSRPPKSASGRRLPNSVTILDQPAHVGSWSAARIPGFVPALLGRWQRARGLLPRRFCLLLCPRVELSARGGLPPRLRALSLPQHRFDHFTSCHRPYMATIFLGPRAGRRCEEAQAQLAWSEAYAVELRSDTLRLRFLGAHEDLDTPPPAHHGRSLRELQRSGELLRLLA